ncbi:hypothetical protein [Flavobacterium daemonense]|uniref:hypothetical protein n=1 Tax=Flavobacterium daemonense TaxID=1393049 RepID=UPI0011856B11|nr:hypothetical protein [Flavobacterium daemonense]KAF2332007.1 hypothetical protein FND99_13315 [Flavobacterium daemonense]
MIKISQLLMMLFFAFLVACNKEKTKEKIFVTSKNYYWQFNSECSNTFGTSVNFQFDKDGTSHQYGFNLKDGYYLIKNSSNAPKKWIVKNDSILIWGNFEYKIEHIDGTIINLSYPNPKDKNTKCLVSLIKVVDGKFID